MKDVEMLVAAAAFALAHLASPRVAARIRNPQGFASFSGGLAVAYVFLHLLPELDEGHEVIGQRIYFFALFGFAVLYSIEVWIGRRRAPETRTGHYELSMGYSFVYTGLLVFTLGSQLPATVPLTILFVISIGMHLVSGDIGALKEYGDRFRNQGRFILAGGAVAGYVLSLLRTPHEAVVDILTAVLGGFMLFTVFHEELPGMSRARLRPFFAGMATFLILHVLLAFGG